MAAPSIPNLNTLRPRAGGPSGLRGRRRNVEDGEQSAEARDRIVQQTDNDASLSRISAVELGYLHDPFARAFVDGPVPRRYPIINRGTYARTTALDSLVLKFLRESGDAQTQVISLGAGSDTRFFRLAVEVPNYTQRLLYHELDFPANTIAKTSAIRRSPDLLGAIHGSLDLPQDPSELVFHVDGTGMRSPTYNLHAIDLRTLADPATAPSVPNLSTTAPTLIISECCLCYLPPATTSSILRTITGTLVPSPTPVGLILYEPIRPHDPFGKVMVSNLAARGIHLQTLEAYSTLSRQKQRLRDVGFMSGQGAADVNFAFEKWIDTEQRERVAGLEMLDELEEWRLLAQHYCVAWGWRDGESEVFGRAWSDVKAQEDDGG
ncbi:hypothetical protein B0A49_12072 [Cryomyces minteri]|uniref:Leucine carboxyl methyltransferase 1 n=1 Tax=Cryomyces minteri TaxID=331657 RepID=A0A4U0W5H5_9PEZI|nr:hypothetical protein B0A49_12072 [Cryomyces minteri]